MKIIYILIVAILLASCSSSSRFDNDQNIVDEAAVEETTNQINKEINNLNSNLDNNWVTITESTWSTWSIVKIVEKSKIK